ncbi:hypothetical protein LPTSP3_g04550 [Leptospira kobayashii]|uniref:STAS/SEC14 domain-containing protein n=1 Tax=Leptospira kobayashii TaxID=1917830 RepID=A0ABN6K9D0_9LEPT|nr:hypothetical protein [Leptospira kobayashii]BDA77525.1 hypothetical protein LPTSP3_g04550 [Leptospira kobayashii]
MDKVIENKWIPEQKLLISHLDGAMDIEDIAAWESSLHQCLNQIEENGTFKIFVNLYGFSGANVEAHKRFRSVIPETLANYGWRVGYLDLFEEAKDLQLKNHRGIQCLAAVHVHQDATKIEKYEENFSRENEHFFTDPARAKEWITGFVV